VEGAYANGGVPNMKADLSAELALLNRNVDEIIGLLQCVTDAGIWTRQEATEHETRLESIRKNFNADYREIMARDERTRKEPTPLKPGS
jgi:hypothetical protein